MPAKQIGKGEKDYTLNSKADYRPSHTGRLVQVFLNTTMICAHKGLTEICKKHGIKVGELKNGEYVVFINTAQNRIKIYTSNNVIAYYKAPTGRIDLQTIRRIPGCFTGSVDFAMDRALREVLEELFVKKVIIRKQGARDRAMSKARALGNILASN